MIIIILYGTLVTVLSENGYQFDNVSTIPVPTVYDYPQQEQLEQSGYEPSLSHSALQQRARVSLLLTQLYSIWPNP